jgi:hypothetical protein
MRLALALAFLCALVLAPSAGAYQLSGDRFPSSTITYYSGTGSLYSKEVSAAAAAWNKSGVNVRWVKTTKSKAAIAIRVEPGIFTAGQAGQTNGVGDILLRPDIKQYAVTATTGRGLATQVIVHEMGHIMGLDHETKVCAIMQPATGLGCKSAPVAWQYRCRLLERDDLRGALKLFGGTTTKLTPQFCAAVPAPAVPTELTATATPPGPDGVPGLRLSWHTPDGQSLEFVRILRRRDVCPTGPNDPLAIEVVHEQAVPRQDQAANDTAGFPEAGKYCYAAVLFGKLNRPGKLTTLNYNAPAAPSSRPRARIDLNSAHSPTIRFYDNSSVDNGQIVAWHWDFADGASSEEQNPTHDFEPGRHTVSLTVTDNQGNAATAKRDVLISEPANMSGDG